MKLIRNELLPIYETDRGEKIVDGRELHEFLQIGRDFSNWIKDRIRKYGFVMSEDFSPIPANDNGGLRSRIEYKLKLDMAKELCMVENNEKGREARKYFIAVEKHFNQIQPKSQAELLLMYAEQFVNMEKRVDQMEQTVTTIKYTIIHRDEDWRRWIKKLFNSSVMHTPEKDFQAIRNESYRILEERARCDLNTRQRNLKSRLEHEGATKTKINSVTKMDVIEADARLKEIYTSIVKELSIKLVPVIK